MNPNKTLGQALEEAIVHSMLPDFKLLLDLHGEYLKTVRFDGDLTPAQVALKTAHVAIVGRDTLSGSLRSVCPYRVEEVALTLLRNGFDLPRTNIVVGTTAHDPMTIAANTHMTRVVLYMIVDMGWSPDMGLSRNTPLVTVCLNYGRRGHADDVLRILLDAGADPNAVDSNNRTALEVRSSISTCKYSLASDFFSGFGFSGFGTRKSPPPADPSP